jgi:hypothetical protein
MSRTTSLERVFDVSHPLPPLWTSPITHREDIIHAVTDEDDRNSLLLQSANEIQETSDLFDPEVGRGLIHHDESGVKGDDPGDGNRLLLASG